MKFYLFRFHRNEPLKYPSNWLWKRTAAESPLKTNWTYNIDVPWTRKKTQRNSKVGQLWFGTYRAPCSSNSWAWGSCERKRFSTRKSWLAECSPRRGYLGYSVHEIPFSLSSMQMKLILITNPTSSPLSPMMLSWWPLREYSHLQTVFSVDLGH